MWINLPFKIDPNKCTSPPFDKNYREWLIEEITEPFKHEILYLLKKEEVRCRQMCVRVRYVYVWL